MTAIPTSALSARDGWSLISLFRESLRLTRAVAWGPAFLPPGNDSMAATQWEAYVRAALQKDILTLYAQPIVHLESGNVTQYELLLRVRDEEGQVSGPGELLSSLEGSTLMAAMDRSVVRRAVELLARLPDGNARLQVNLSAQALSDPALLQLVVEELEQEGADPRRLILEITQTSAIFDTNSAGGLLRELRRLGCGLAIDDFGTGFSSMHLLKCLDVDYLKIGASFVGDLLSNARDQFLVKSMVNTARGLGIATIAEGAEDEATVEALRGLDVDYAQGFHLGRPAPTDHWYRHKES